MAGYYRCVTSAISWRCGGPQPLGDLGASWVQLDVQGQGRLGSALVVQMNSHEAVATMRVRCLTVTANSNSEGNRVSAPMTWVGKTPLRISLG